MPFFTFPAIIFSLINLFKKYDLKDSYDLSDTFDPEQHQLFGPNLSVIYL
jgi:TRAP-type C4-dicarboxylate transport system permease small subunit